MLQNRREFQTELLGGVDRSVHETKLPFVGTTSFQTLTNIVPAQPIPGGFTHELWSLGRLDGCTKLVSTLSGTDRIARLHLFRRVGSADEILAVIHRTGTTDALYKRNGAAWSLIGALPGTGRSYSLVSWRNKAFILDGTNAPRVYDGSTISTLTGTNIPPDPQYGTVHQDRLMLGGGPTNRDRVWFSNVLDETVFGAAAYFNVNTGTGDQITVIATNSISTSTAGAQTQLAVLKTAGAVLINGTIGGGSEVVSVLSAKAGCPSGRTAVNTPFGLIYAGTTSVQRLNPNSTEAIDTGIHLGGELGNIVDQTFAAGAYHCNFYRLSVPTATGSINTREWMLALYEQVFPAKTLWYGPHLGDQISEYLTVDNTLYAARAETTELWKLHVENNSFSMTDQVNPRNAVVQLPTLVSTSLRRWLIDAVGALVTAQPGDSLRFTVTTAGTDQVSQLVSSVTASGNTLTWDSGTWDNFTWGGSKDLVLLVRPRQQGFGTTVKVEHQQDSALLIHNLYVRIRESHRQPQSD